MQQIKARTKCLITDIPLSPEKIVSDTTGEFIYVYPHNPNLQICFTDYAIDLYDETKNTPELHEKLKGNLLVEVSKFISSMQPTKENPLAITFDNEWMMILVSS